MTERSSHFLLLPLLPICLGLVLGILLADWLDFRPVFSLPVAILIVVVLIVRSRVREPLWRMGLLIIACLLVGILRYDNWQNGQFDQQLIEVLPLRFEHLEASVLQHGTGSGRSLIAELRYGQLDTTKIALTGSILLQLPWQSRFELLPGQIVRLSDAELQIADGPRNPGQFDFRQFLMRRGISAVCRLNEEAQVAIVADRFELTLESAMMYPLRRRLMAGLDAYLPTDVAGLLKALLLGVRSDLEKHIKDDFAGAGVLHVLAISGLHVGFIAWLLLLIFSFVPLPRTRQHLLVIAGLCGYMLLATANPPVVRATLMASLLLLAKNLERRCHPFQFILVAISGILIWEPAQLFRVDFQFSCIAVFSILLFLPRLMPIAHRLASWIPVEPWRSPIMNGILLPGCLSIAAQIGTMPLTAFYFQQVSPLSFLFSIAVIPLAGLLVVLGSILMLLTACQLPVAADLADIVVLIAKMLNNGVAFAADLPLSRVAMSQPDAMDLLLYLAIVVLAFSGGRRWLRKLCALVILLALALSALNNGQRFDELQILMLDVRQGDAALLMTPGDVNVLIDAGPAGEFWDAGERVVEPVMRHLGNTYIDHLFISHAHLDHIGGAFYLLDQGLVGNAYLPESEKRDVLADSLVNLCRRQNVALHFLKMGDVVSLDQETRAYVFGPPEKIPAGGDLNNHSLVFQILYRGRRLLFTGDIEYEAESSLLAWGANLKSDFLKIAHHGSRTSSSESFLEAVSPRIATISCARNNRFGHPSPLVLARLSALEIHYYQTANHGAIWLKLDRDGLRFREDVDIHRGRLQKRKGAK